MKILMVCTGNTCRSPMAEGILKDILNKSDIDSENIQVVSAGITAQNGLPASEKAVNILEDVGIDISEHESRQLSIALVKEADIILAMTKNHKHIITTMIPEAKSKTFTLKEFAMGNLDYEDILDEIRTMYSISDKKRDELERQREEKIIMLKERKNSLKNELRQIEKEIEKLSIKDDVVDKTDIAKLKLIENKLKDMDIKDPYGMPLSIYRTTSEEITESIKNIVKKIIEEQSK